MARGNEEQFQEILRRLSDNTRKYELGQTKYISYVDNIDHIFGSYTWDKTEFNQELNKRLGIETNDTRQKKPSSIPPPMKKKTTKKKV